MASAWQTLLSVHHRIVDNGGMMLIIFHHILSSFSFSYAAVVGDVVRVKHACAVCVCSVCGSCRCAFTMAALWLAP